MEIIRNLAKNVPKPLQALIGKTVGSTSKHADTLTLSEATSRMETIKEVFHDARRAWVGFQGEAVLPAQSSSGAQRKRTAAERCPSESHSETSEVPSGVAAPAARTTRKNDQSDTDTSRELKRKLLEVLQQGTGSDDQILTLARDLVQGRSSTTLSSHPSQRRVVGLPFQPPIPTGPNSAAPTDVLQVDFTADCLHGCRWAQQRADFPPRCPSSVLQWQLLPSWKPVSDDTVMLVAFESTKLADTWESQMWEFWRDGLAMCGILVKELFLGTQIDTNAYYKGGADEQPAVRVPKLNVTLVWFVGRDGYVRIDGPTWAKPAALKLLRKGLVPFKPGNMNHGRETGKQAKPERVAAGLLKSDLSQRAQWENERRDSVLLLPPCLIFDAAGRKGIHDILQDKVGIKNIPSWNSTPWLMVTCAGSVVQIFPEGRAVVALGTGSVQEATKVEQILKGHFNGNSMPAGQYRTMLKVPNKIGYGTPGAVPWGSGKGSQRPPLAGKGPYKGK